MASAGSSGVSVPSCVPAPSLVLPHSLPSHHILVRPKGELHCCFKKFMYSFALQTCSKTREASPVSGL